MTAGPSVVRRECTPSAHLYAVGMSHGAVAPRLPTTATLNTLRDSYAAAVSPCGLDPFMAAFCDGFIAVSGCGLVAFSRS